MEHSVDFMEHSVDLMKYMGLLKLLQLEDLLLTILTGFMQFSMRCFQREETA